MDEEAKILLYNQLLKFTDMADVKRKRLIKWENYAKLSNKEILRYTLAYRDRCTNEYNKHTRKKEKRIFYLELPNMNLEGEDLTDFYIHHFMPGFAREDDDGKKIFVSTKINLKNTNCVINMASIRPIIISLDGTTIKEISADITKCDFRGCTVFGKFQNSKAKLEYTENNLPKEYIDRLINFKVPPEVILTTDNMYLDMLEGKVVRGTIGLENVKQIVDYDLTNLKKRSLEI